MIRLGLLQFKHAWRLWLTASFVFGVSGWLIALCTIGLTSIQAVITRADGPSVDPTPMFVSPMIFGGLTLFFVMAGVIRQVIQALRREYQLWVTLGSTPRQVALLVGTQLGVLGALAGGGGYWCAVLMIGPVYSHLQALIGRDMLPDVAFSASLTSWGLTMAIVILTCLLGGSLRTRQVLARALGAEPRVSASAGFFTAVALIGLVAAIGYIWRDDWSLGLPQAPALKGVQGLFFALFFLVFLQTAASRWGLSWLLRGLTKVSAGCQGGLISTARAQSLANAAQIVTAGVPVLIVQTLVAGLYAILFGLAGPEGVDVANAVAAFFAYAGAPALLVIANVVTMTMLKSSQQLDHLRQLHGLGFTRAQLIGARFLEDVYASVLLWLAMLLSDTGLFLLLQVVCVKLGTSARVGVTSLWAIAGVTALIDLIVFGCLDGVYVGRAPLDQVAR
ncbi:hypothetical protein [Lacticaseibacillus absianus]|uniref:hypothetical protein n=1 Tax=Lacticaseibacillus absianus TaxID=2729623 RepID=UPI0015C9E423|nr:hypothetical protein [Lacticaseibacillus absianus]